MFSNSFIEIAYMQYVRLSVELDASGLYGGIGSLPFSAEVPNFLLFPRKPFYSHALKIPIDVTVNMVN